MTDPGVAHGRFSLYFNDAFLAHYHKPARSRLRGLASNPAIPGELLRRLVDERRKEVESTVVHRSTWTGEQFDALAGHADPKVRRLLAVAPCVTPDQRVQLIDDPADEVCRALFEGPDFAWWTSRPEPLMPVWAYERLLARRPELEWLLIDSPWVPEELRDRLQPPATNTGTGTGTPQETPAPLTREEAEAQAGDDNPWTRARIAGDPRLPADLVAQLAVDPSPEVRLAVSMREELTEEQRAAVDHRVGRDDRIRPAEWLARTEDPAVLRRGALSGHIGLRRSAASHPRLPHDLVLVLAGDDDFAVRLLLCERHDSVPGETVLQTYIEARTMTRDRLLRHPNFPRTGLARLAGSPDPYARVLVRLDPHVPPWLIERLSHDPHPDVRQSVARDARLPVTRVLELFADEYTTEPAAANPKLPSALMEGILADAADLDHDDDHEEAGGKQVVYLGNWDPENLPDPE